MNVITISLGQGGCIDAPLLLGYAGENDVEAVDFDFSAWAEAYGEGSLALELMRASDTAPYPAVLTIDGTVARWTVSDVDTARSGPGVAQLVYKVDGKVKKSMVFKFFVGSSIRESGDEDPWGPILDRMEEILAEVQRQAAAADQSAEAAGGSAQNAEAWAVGERGGEPVPAEDPTHANNAKYYAEQAGETAREFAEETAPAAVRAVNEAGAANVQQINEAGTAALEVIGTARTGALDAIGTEKTGALNAIDTAGQTAGSAVDTAKTDAVQAVNTTKTDALTAVGNAQTAAVGAVRQEGTTQQDAVKQKGEDALAELQEYADLPGEVDALKTAVDTKAPAIYNTASGSIASFDDGADNMPLKGLTVNIEPVQTGEGDPSPENVRPITGWTGCNVEHAAKNLGNFADNKSIANSGFIAAVDGRVATVDPVVINPGCTYKAVCNDASVKVILAVWNGDTLVRRTASLNVGTVLDTAGGTHFYVSCYKTDPVTVDGVKPMIVFADETDLTYEPYAGNIYDITFPTEAGTVYGGTLDVVNKKLTVDRAIVTVTEAGKLTVGNEFAYFRPQPRPAYPNVIDPISNCTDSITITSNQYIRFNDRMGDESAEEYLSRHGGSITVVYEITPIVYDLSDVPKITTLLGTNNIWADTGDVTVEYAVDTETYVDGNTDAIRDMIAGVETGTTVSKAYTVGQLLIADDTLYKVIAPEGIASGGTLTPGTNVQVTTVADELADTGNRITALDTQVNADIASLKAETTELGILQPLSLLSMADYGEDEEKVLTYRRVKKVGNRFYTSMSSPSTTYRFFRLFGGMSVFDAWASNDFSFDNSIAIPSVTGCEVYAVCRYKHISGGGNPTRIDFIEVDAENNVTLHNGPYITGPGIFMVKLDPAKHFNADLYSRNAAKVDEVEISLIAFPTITTT